MASFEPAGAMKEKTSEFRKSATAELARRLDVELEYINAAGARIAIAPKVVRALLAAMGYPAKNDVDAEVFLRSLTDKERSRRLLAVLVVNPKPGIVTNGGWSAKSTKSQRRFAGGRAINSLGSGPDGRRRFRNQLGSPDCRTTLRLPSI